MIDLPQQAELPIDRLCSVFNDTTNSYKYYWFLAIIDEIELADQNEIPISRLAKNMISKVWYPLNFYRLSFGKLDGFKRISDYISELCEVDNSANSKDIFEQIQGLGKDELSTLEGLTKDLLRWVPFRFQRPFLEETYGLKDWQVNKKIEELSITYSKTNPSKCPYYFVGNNIKVNEVWRSYFVKHSFILKSFAYWHLCKFVQKNNPNVIGVSEKLFKPQSRNLLKNINSWKSYLKSKTEVRCIYTNEVITEGFSLDHFLPWSYVVHDLNWNLIPTLKNTNSKKGNSLPNLSIYLDKFICMQYDFLKTVSLSNSHKEIIEQYCNLFGLEVGEIKLLSHDEFKQKLQNIILPLYQNAVNMGFRESWTYVL